MNSPSHRIGVVAEQPHLLVVMHQDLHRHTLASFMQQNWPDLQVSEMACLPKTNIDDLFQHVKLVLIDSAIADLKPIQLVEAAQTRLTEQYLVLLVDDISQQDALECFQHGVAGIIPKTLPPDATINALKLILCGEKYLPPFILSPQDSVSDSYSPKRRLTSREKTVMGLLTMGCSNKDIAQHLNIQEITVKSHMKSIFRKLNTKNRTQAAKIAMEMGLSPAK